MAAIKENLKMTGELDIVLMDANGNIKDSRKVHNLVVDDGLDFITSRMVGATPGIMSHMGVGSDNTAAAAGDTTITQLGSRAALTSDNKAANVVTYIATFGAGVGTGAVVEAGLFNSATVGDMLCRTVFAVVNKAADDIMTINWAITLTAV